MKATNVLLAGILVVLAFIAINLVMPPPTTLEPANAAQDWAHPMCYAGYSCIRPVPRATR